jgi:hypothetical protein
VWLVLVVLV